MNQPASQGASSRISSAELAQAERREQIPRSVVYGLRLALVLLVAMGWEFAARRNWIDPFFCSMPSAIALELFYWFRDGTAQGPLFTQLQITFAEALLGLAAGSIAGAGLAIALVRNKLLAEVFGFYLKLANALPVMVLGAIFAITLESGVAWKAALAVVMAFFVVFGNAYQRVRMLDGQTADVGSAPAAGREVISTTLRATLESLRMAFALALAGTLAGEFLGSAQGLGCVIASSVREFNASGVFAAVIVIGVAAWITDYLLGELQQRLLMLRMRR